ncbi:3-methyl-2-oxobutanoate hydroxymethyltransferase [Thioalkalivibrio paradoxus]|uniref:3-methyl-2-oxobutanoate hydroxymethyltransferase n=1 Tax=Thioalkalivibrio paradoxus ARh 1 TaxID=713585 RepID=W0DPE9_9GAMM|nr:3-methyl-2-oxobutanoate hydroxymethyltransferase [Thioalkalivibrio paradoxus]AHE99127.1 3-methyl-2-oxobutanoate hydroxymethyltransferase [Thioalkalivibrio paradoxus ARh 1]
MRTTIRTLEKYKHEHRPITCLTAYDASFARLLDAADIDVILVGDSLGMVVQGHDTTLPVTIEQMIYHLEAVARGARRALLMADLPFLGDRDAATAVEQGGALMRAGAQMIKVECRGGHADLVQRMVGAGIPVCAHLGLTPQAVHQYGGYRVQGRGVVAAEQMQAEARALEVAGAQCLLLESVPELLATRITHAAGVPVIGIGASPECDGQVLVLQDVIGLTPKPPRFAQDFLAGAGSLAAAVAAYADAVRSRRFPVSGVHTFD